VIREVKRMKYKKVFSGKGGSIIIASITLIDISVGFISIGFIAESGNDIKIAGPLVGISVLLTSLGMLVWGIYLKTKN